MTHQTGNETLPVPASDFTDEQPGTPAFKIMLDELERGIVEYCGEAWRAHAPEEYIVRRTFLRKPMEGDFKSQSLPALYLWPERTVGRRRLADEITLTKYRVAVLWVQPPTHTTRQQFVRAFWTRVDQAINATVNPAGASIDTDSDDWGEMLKDKMGAWSVELGDCIEQDLEIGTAEKKKTYPAYLWRFTVELNLAYDFATPTGPGGPSCLKMTFKVKHPDGDVDILESDLS